MQGRRTIIPRILAKPYLSFTTSEERQQFITALQNLSDRDLLTVLGAQSNFSLLRLHDSMTRFTQDTSKRRGFVVRFNTAFDIEFSNRNKLTETILSPEEIHRKALDNLRIQQNEYLVKKLYQQALFDFNSGAALRRYGDSFKFFQSRFNPNTQQLTLIWENPLRTAGDSHVQIILSKEQVLQLAGHQLIELNITQQNREKLEKQVANAPEVQRPEKAPPSSPEVAIDPILKKQFHTVPALPFITALMKGLENGNTIVQLLYHQNEAALKALRDYSKNLKSATGIPLHMYAQTMLDAKKGPTPRPAPLLSDQMTSALTCPLSKQLFREPVLLTKAGDRGYGYVFEKDELRKRGYSERDFIQDRYTEQLIEARNNVSTQNPQNATTQENLRENIEEIITDPVALDKAQDIYFFAQGQLTSKAVVVEAVRVKYQRDMTFEDAAQSRRQFKIQNPQTRAEQTVASLVPNQNLNHISNLTDSPQRNIAAFRTPLPSNTRVIQQHPAAPRSAQTEGLRNQARNAKIVIGEKRRAPDRERNIEPPARPGIQRTQATRNLGRVREGAAQADNDARPNGPSRRRH